MSADPGCPLCGGQHLMGRCVDTWTDDDAGLVYAAPRIRLGMFWMVCRCGQVFCGHDDEFEPARDAALAHRCEI